MSAVRVAVVAIVVVGADMDEELASGRLLVLFKKELERPSYSQETPSK